MELDQDACYRAVVTRDIRFDGRIFGAVKTTGIYCRPVCPARTPRRENMIFYASAAAAETAGFRACLRCRPETAPDLAAWRGGLSAGGAWRGTANTVSRALSLIEQGALDGSSDSGGDVEALAGRLGIGERQLRRLFRQHLGAAPISVAQTRRVLLAKQLIHDSDLSMAQVALASGFGSVRRFNETFQRLYDRPPLALRRRGERSADPAEGVRLSLRYRPPYDWAGLLAALAARGDDVTDNQWSKTLEPPADGAAGWVRVRSAPNDSLAVTVALTNLRALPGILARVRRVFDLAADPQAIASDLATDPLLASLVQARPGLRLPGAWIDDLDDLPSDRLDPAWTISPERAEPWRPWRAYGVLHLRMAGLTDADLATMETADARDAA